MSNANSQPRPWGEVASSEQFRSLPPEHQERARQLYFQDVVLPRVPAGMEGRARKLFDQDTAGTAGQAGSDEQGMRATDFAKEAGAGALTGTGAVVSGLGDLIRPDDNGLSNTLPDGTELPEIPTLRGAIADAVDPVARAAGSWISEKGDALRGTESQAAQQARENSTPGGDVLSPSTWSLGKKPSLAGYGLQMAGLVGQFVPAAATLAATRGRSGVQMPAMAAVGGLQAGGAAGDEVEQRIAGTSDLELAAQSPVYRELRDKGVGEEEARQQLTILARDGAFEGAAPVGALGGAATQFALGPLQRIIGGGVGRRLAGGLLIDAPVEGAQEVAESVAARVGVNQATGEDHSLTENTFGDALLGALGGAGHASLGAAMGEGKEHGRVPVVAADADFENTPEQAALPAPGLASLPPPEQTFYADSQGNMQDTGPVRSVDGEMQPDVQARRWVNPQNDPARSAGGPGMEQRVPRGEPAPLEGQLQLGARQEQAAPQRKPQTIDAEPERAALPAPETIVVDTLGNAQRGPVAPQIPRVQMQGGRGMDQQAPTAQPRDRTQGELLHKPNGKPFDAPKGAEASKAFREARTAGRQPRVIPVKGGYAIQLQPEEVRHEMRPLDSAAHEAATSPNNDLPAPTPAQIEAGNYKKGKVRVHGLELSIENPRGSERSGKRPDGSEWRHTMGDHYGYIKRTTGADGEQVDVYLGPHEQSDQVFVVDQLNQQDESFDEHKVMVGYPDQESAVAAYRSNFDADWKVGQVTAMPVAQFKEWLKGGDLAKPAADNSGEVSLEADQQPIAEEAQAQPQAEQKANIKDFGEKIGGARKDRAASTGATPRRASSGDTRPAWARRFEISQVVSSSNTAEVGRWEVRDSRSKDWMKQPKKVGTGTYATREEAEQAVPLIAVAQKHRAVPLRHGEGTGFEIWRSISDRKRVKVVDQVFPSRDAAMEYMAANAQQIIETNTTFGEADLPRPENALRIGAARREGPVKDRDFIDTFGFRGVEFGNWNNQDERQQLLDDAYDGLLDLAEVMDIPPKAISLNGDLALAFGARGHGLSGARAHYEPHKAAINLTKMNGAGSLAHEWFHALDHYFGRQDGKASAEWVIDEDGTRSLKASDSFERDAASSGFRRAGSGVRLEVRQAYTQLMDTMQRKAEQYVEDTARADSFVARARDEVADRLKRLRADLAEQKNPQYWKRHNKPASAEQLASFDTVVQQILDGVQLDTELRATNPDAPVKVRGRGTFSGMRWTNDALEQLSAIYKAVRGRSGFNADHNGELDRLRGAMGTYSSRLKMLAEAQGGAEKTKHVPTQFAMDAKELDQGRGTDYWTTPHEMAARAFQGYVEDMIAERGGKSPFLNYGPENAGIPTPWGWKRPFPAGEERKAINLAFDNLVDAIETRETEEGVQLYSQGAEAETGASGVQVAAKQLRDTLKTLPELAGVEVVQGFEDLPLSTRTRAKRDGVAPEDLRGVRSSGKTYVVAGNHSSLADAIYTAVHEEVGHRGIRGLLGEELDSTMERLYSSQQATAKGRQRIGQIRDAYASVLKRLDAKQQRVLVAQEMVAHLLEDGDRPTMLQRVLSKIRELLRQMFPQVPWTYTDILALGEQSRAWLRRQNGQRDADQAVLYSRRGWSEAFPDTVLAHPLSFLNNHPDYPAAKAGDDAAALRLARDAVTPEFVEQARALIPEGSKPRIVPVLAREGAGDNRIPLMVAKVLAKRLGLQVDTKPIQAEKVGRTQANALERIANQPTFAGEVATGDFLIIDDTLTQGGTLAQLKTHIEDNGGRVLAALALTGKNYSRKLAIDPSTLAEVRGKYGDIEPWWRDTFGYGFEGLTQSEARTLLTFDKGQLSPEQLRDRLAAAQFRGLSEVGGRAAGDRSGTEAPVDPGDTLYSLGAARRPHTSEAFPDLNAAEQAALRKIAPLTARERAIDWYRERTDRLMTKIRQGLVDRYAALKELDERLHGSDFLDTSITSSAWVLARMAPAAAGALNSMLHNGRIVFDQRQKVISSRDDGSMGLGEVLSRLGEAKEIERFLGWIAGNRAAKLAAEGRENLFDAQDIAALKGINRGNTADGRSRAKLYDEVFREFQQYRDDVLAIAEQTGIISSESRAMWRDEFYVPFYRVMDEEAKGGGPRAAKGLSRQEAYKKLKGGKQNLNDLLENTLMNFHHLLTASLKNQAAAQAIDNAIKLEIAQEVKESARDPKSSTFVLKGGERIWYQIDDALVFEALTSLADPGLNNFAVRTMAKFKRVFTNMTTITPQFIVANFLRDSMQAAATTPVSKNAPGNMYQGLKSYRDEKTRARLLAGGGAFSFGHIYGADPEEVKAGLRRNLRGAKLVDGPKAIPKLLMAGWDAYNGFANTMENANRAAAFQQNLDKGTLRAAYEARDLMDFSQEGAWPAVRFLVRTVPFLNARLQGLDKLYRSGAKPAVLTAFGKGTASDRVAAARFATVTGALALASMLLYLANHDDEEYRKLEDWQKDSYWFFRIGDQAFFLPKPFEVGAISTLAERTLEQFVDDKATGKLFRDRLQVMLTQTFSFSPVPQAFQPALDVYANKDAFTGRPIESAGMERVSPTLRARATTTAPAKIISEATSVLGDGLTLSPLQADHLIQGYLGQVGAWVAGITDTIWRTANGETEPAKRWSEYQPIKRFYRDLGAPAPYDRYSTLFYEGLKESGRVYADVKRLQELGRLDEARELVQEKRGELAMRKSLNQTQRQLSAINARMDVVRLGGMDAEGKRRELDRLSVIKSRLTERAGKRIEDIRARE
nr:LPD38 domain-containing protein [uncultured Pseudomonas sp.]